MNSMPYKDTCANMGQLHAYEAGALSTANSIVVRQTTRKRRPSGRQSIMVRARLARARCVRVRSFRAGWIMRWETHKDWAKHIGELACSTGFIETSFKVVLQAMCVMLQTVPCTADSVHQLRNTACVMSTGRPLQMRSIERSPFALGTFFKSSPLCCVCRAGASFSANFRIVERPNCRGLFIPQMWWPTRRCLSS